VSQSHKGDESDKSIEIVQYPLVAYIDSRPIFTPPCLSIFAAGRSRFKAKTTHKNEVHGSNWFRTGSLYYILSRTVNWTHWQTCKPEPDRTRTLGPVQRFEVRTEVQDRTSAAL